MGRRAIRRSERFIEVALFAIFGLSAVIIAGTQGAGASQAPALSVTPQGNYHDGQSIAIAAGANSFFTPNARINILECADPGGLASNLPIDDSTCDGNTVQANTILVGANGSFAEAAYTLYLLPSSTLAEQSNNKPICNQTNYCVLYVGQDQNNFSAPKVFSAPFLMGPSAGTADGSTSANAGSNASSGTTGGTGTVAVPKSSSSTSVGLQSVWRHRHLWPIQVPQLTSSGSPCWEWPCSSAA